MAVRIQECDELRGYIKEKLQLTHKKNQESKNNLDYTRTLLLEARKIKQLEDDEANGGDYDDDNSDDEENTEENDIIQTDGTGPSLNKIRRRKLSRFSDSSMSVHSMAPSGTFVWCDDDVTEPACY